MVPLEQRNAVIALRNAQSPARRRETHRPHLPPPKHAIFRFGYQSHALGMVWYDDLMATDALHRLLLTFVDRFMKLPGGEELMQRTSKTLVLVCRTNEL